MVQWDRINFFVYIFAFNLKRILTFVKCSKNYLDS